MLDTLIKKKLVNKFEFPYSISDPTTHFRFKILAQIKPIHRGSLFRNIIVQEDVYKAMRDLKFCDPVAAPILTQNIVTLLFEK